MNRVRLGAVSYLNARPLVFGLERAPEFDLRFDVPSRCASLLHSGDIDVGLIPSIEYLRAPSGTDYAIVPGLAIASRGPVASVALYTTRAIGDVRSIALDTSSRTSVALVRVLCARAFAIDPELLPQQPDLETMLSSADAALVIGDNALIWNPAAVQVRDARGRFETRPVEKIDLGSTWTTLTGLPFVYAFWAGRQDALTATQVDALQRAGREGVQRAAQIGSDYFAGTPEHQAAGAAYLRDNIRYDLGDDERAGLERFFQYAAEVGLVRSPGPLRFY